MTIKNRLQKLEAKHAPKDINFCVVIYGKDGRAMKCSSPELIGLTREEVAARLGDTRRIDVLPASYQGAVFIPDNGRGDL